MCLLDFSERMAEVREALGKDEEEEKIYNEVHEYLTNHHGSRIAGLYISERSERDGR